jgi:hypothetical protein
MKLSVGVLPHAIRGPLVRAGIAECLPDIPSPAGKIERRGRPHDHEKKAGKKQGSMEEMFHGDILTDKR